MKTKLLLLVSIAAFFTNIMYGQKCYFKLDMGYGLGINGSDFITSSRTYNITVDTTTYYDTYHNKKTSFGTGIYPSFTFGYIINKYFSVELNFLYFNEKSKVFKTQDDYNIVYGYSSCATYQSTFSDRSVYVIPNFILSPNYSNINPYIKLGVMVGKGRIKIDNDNTLYNAFSGSSTPYSHLINEWINYSGLSYGIKSTFGLEIYFTERTKLFGELSYSSITTTPIKAKMKSCTLNGVDQMPTMTVSDKEIVFVDDYSDIPQSDLNSPRQELKTSFNLNALSLNFGIKYTFK